MEKTQILTPEQREYVNTYAQRLAQLAEYTAEIEAGDRKHEAEALDVCAWVQRQGDNPAFLARQIGEAVRPTTPATIYPGHTPAQQPKPALPPTWAERFDNSGRAGRR